MRRGGRTCHTTFWNVHDGCEGKGGGRKLLGARARRVVMGKGKRGDGRGEAVMRCLQGLAGREVVPGALGLSPRVWGGLGLPRKEVRRGARLGARGRSDSDVSSWGSGESRALTLGIVQGGDSAEGLRTPQWLPQMTAQDGGMSLSRGRRGTERESSAEPGLEMGGRASEGTRHRPARQRLREQSHSSRSQ